MFWWSTEIKHIIFFIRTKKVSPLCGQLNDLRGTCGCMKSIFTPPWSASTSVIIPIHQNELYRLVTYVDDLISVISKVVSKLKSNVSTNLSSALVSASLKEKIQTSALPHNCFDLSATRLKTLQIRA